jgi:hypothetical protein
MDERGKLRSKLGKAGDSAKDPLGRALAILGILGALAVMAVNVG